MAQPYLNAPLVKTEGAVVEARVDGDADGNGRDDARGPTFTALFDSATVTRVQPEDATRTALVVGTAMNGIEAVEDVPVVLSQTQDVVARADTVPSDIPAVDPAQSPSLALPAVAIPSTAAATAATTAKPNVNANADAAANAAANASALLPLRTRSSCTNCRQRKQRCDHGAPGEPCKGCVKGGKVCVYPVIPNVPVSSKSKRSKKSAQWKGELDASKRLVNPPRINRDFTDSEEEHRGYTSSHSSSRRETRSARAGASGRAQGDRRNGDEVDELDDEEEDEVEEEEALEDQAIPAVTRPAAPADAGSIRYTSHTINGHTAQMADMMHRPASSRGSTSPAGHHHHQHHHRTALSRSSTADPLARSPSRDRAHVGKRPSDAFRHAVVEQSPFAAGKSKRKGGQGVTEGEVEGEILALVEEDQRPSKSKKSRHASPRGSNRSDAAAHMGGYHPDDGFFPSTGRQVHGYVDSRPGAYPSSSAATHRSSGGGGGSGGGSFFGTYHANPGPGLSHPASVPPSAQALLGYGQTGAGGGSAYGAQGRGTSVGVGGMVVGYPPYAPFVGHPLAPHPTSMSIPGSSQAMPGHPTRSVYDLGAGSSHLATPTGEFAPRIGQESHAPLATPYAASLGALLAVLPPPGTQHILYQTFFQDAFLAEGVTLLQAPFTDEMRYLIHRRSTQPAHPMSMPNGTMEPLKNGDATTLALAFAILASALRVLPEESSQLLLSSVDPQAYPRPLDRVIQGRHAAQADDKATPLHRRYMDHACLAATFAETDDSPSIMHVCFKLVCYRYAKLCVREPGVNVATGHAVRARPRERSVMAGLSLVQAIKMAQSINLHREREGGTLFERELRRRVFYALYTADRLHAFETSSPYMIQDHHASTVVPSAISDSELFQYTTSGHASALPRFDYTHNPSPLVHLVVTAHITKAVTPLLDTLATHSAVDLSPEAVERYDAAFQACEEDLPTYYHLAPATNTSHDHQDPYLLFHRLDTQALLYNLRMSLYRQQLVAHLSIKTPHAIRKKLAKLCYRTLRIHRSARIQEPKFAFRLFSVERVFEAAFTLGFIARVEIAYSAASAARPPGSASYSYASEESIEDMQQGLTDAIELLEGVTAWPDVGAFAVKTVKILRKVAKLLSGSWNLEPKRADSHADDPVRSHPHTARVTAWLKSWRGLDVEALIADADYDDWNKVLRSMQA
ncbi:hypothetical protein NliqN6_5442 [Naganishia liquefaciens]|uniref:Zn(2)-C6 fungal-type domain-containing protein n=1 Tax=Naganishia liquefaciens TaxID=104408 RepID=A0A8H3TY87_9TREE|nr:hypothetical protein NliqN6_5442 [Naganishia liquefaciens]